MSRTNIFQVAMSPEGAIALKKRAALHGLKPATCARMLLNTALRVQPEDAAPPTKKAKR